MVSRRETRILAIALFLFLNPIVLAGVDTTVKDLRIKTFTTRIGTNGGGIDGELFITVYQPNDEGEHPAFVMSPGSWEYGKAWDVYFPPFTPEFIASQGYTVVTSGIPEGLLCLPLAGRSSATFLSLKDME